MIGNTFASNVKSVVRLFPDAAQMVLSSAVPFSRHFSTGIKKERVLPLSNNAEGVRASIANQAPRDALQTLALAFKQGTLTDRETIMLTTPEHLSGFLSSSLNVSGVTDSDVIKKPNPGFGAPGAATGKVALSVTEADKYIKAGQQYIFVLKETHPEHMDYIKKANGVVTFEGGVTSHASIVARQMGKPAIIGTGQLSLKNGQVISIDGLSALIFSREFSICNPDPENEALRKILAIADNIQVDKVHKIKVKANVDTPEDALKARALGAEGIGVVRTEHMFFGSERLPHMQAMIMAQNEEQRRTALDILFPMQKEDFKGILRAMHELPVTIRLLDAPLHEFMPDDSKQAEAFKESNPMLGNRAVRLNIQNPEIYKMQVRAILTAAAELAKEGVKVQPQIMIPLVHTVGEVNFCKNQIAEVAKELESTEGAEITFKVGVMVELPGACLEASEIAPRVDFFSFGTNDLTQTTLGLSRDDTAPGIALYINCHIYKFDPFQTIYPSVGTLMHTAITKGKLANPCLDISVCGEHGGDPVSIRTFQALRVDSVSVSPPRIPLAKLSVAQAMLEEHAKTIHKFRDAVLDKRQSHSTLQSTR